MIPAWLRDHLEQRGLWDTDGVGRGAKVQRCRKCREYVLVGLDADRCALPVACDPDPLSRLGEAAAVIAGRTTYSLRWLSDRLELDHRGHFEIRGDARCGDVCCPAKANCRDPDCSMAREDLDLRHDVLASHSCGEPSIGAAAGLGAESRLRPVAGNPPGATPPF